MRRFFIFSKVAIASALICLTSSCHQTALRGDSARERRPAQSEEAFALRPGFIRAEDWKPGKKTVCAITLNSDNEIKTFQKFLSPDKFQFVEFVGFENDWLRKAQDSNVRCDIVLISSHFGGNFFGTKGRMEVAEMERMSCESDHLGLFHSAKEVFLFGCNTLAGKDRDSRTPEEYRAVLRDHGFSASQADQVTSLRYSPIGSTFNDRMSRIFAGVPRVYGFYTKGPLGEDVQPPLEDYLRKIPDYATYLDHLDDSKNDAFIKSLSVYSVIQTRGTILDQNNFVPRCFLDDQSITDGRKISWIHEALLNPQKRYGYLPEISDYLLSRQQSSASRFQNEKILASLSTNAALKNDMHNMMLKTLVNFPDLQWNLAKISMYFGWLSITQEQQMKQDLIGRFFTTNRLSPSGRDLLCTHWDIAREIVDFNMVKNTPRDGNFVATMQCLQTKNVDIQLYLVGLLRDFQGNDGAYARGLISSAFHDIPLKDKRVTDALINEMLTNPDATSREFAAISLKEALTPSPEILAALAKAQNDPDSSVAERAGWSLKDLKEKAQAPQ